VEELSQGSSGSLLLHHVSGFLVLSQLTKHTSRHALNVFNVAVQQLKKIIINKQINME